MFTMSFETGNDAFAGGGYRDEIARILNEVRDRVIDDNDSAGNIRDVNGNTIGKWKFHLSK